MKVSKQKAAENRRALVQAAARLFGERGIDGVGVAEISKEAGLTHGALYAQFASKEALAAEALTYGLQRGYAWLTATSDDGAHSLADFLDFYLSRRHCDDVAGGCVMAASASEIARQDQTICARFSEGFALMAGALEAALDGGSPAMGGGDRRNRALAMAAAMIGGVAVARATAKARPALSDELLVAVRRVLGELGGAPPRPARPASATGQGAAPRTATRPRRRRRP